MENSSGNWQERLRLWIKKQFSHLIAAFAVIIGFLGNPIKAYAALVGEEPTEFSALEPIVENLIKAAVPIAGVVLFGMLVFGGIQYLTSGGDPEGMQKAKSTLTYAIIGIVLLVLTWFVLLFIKTFTGVDVTTFTIPSP
ncbi:hypothetical protein IH980_02725 [Patescibacteria group bacterium]|nr:hypothetical protein [Patescibacteria group bacterium]